MWIITMSKQGTWHRVTPSVKLPLHLLCPSLSHHPMSAMFRSFQTRSQTEEAETEESQSLKDKARQGNKTRTTAPLVEVWGIARGVLLLLQADDGALISESSRNSVTTFKLNFMCKKIDEHTQLITQLMEEVLRSFIWGKISNLSFSTEGVKNKTLTSWDQCTCRRRWYFRTRCIGTTSRSLRVNLP